MLYLIGEDPIETFKIMYDYGKTGKSIVSILNRSVPLYISAVAVAVGFKMGLFNIGVESQYLLGALLSAALGAAVALPSFLHITLIIFVAVISSAFWAAIAGYLKVKKGVHEVISTIMLNYIGTGIIAYLLANIFFEKVELSTTAPQTDLLPETARIPSLNAFLGIEDLPNLHGFIIGAVFIGILYYWIVWKTSLGFDLRATGSSPMAAKFSGANPARLTILAMMISGGFAGFVGIAPLTGYFFKYTTDFPSGLGFAGITVALLGRNHPVGMALGAILLSFLERSAQILDLKDVPKEIEKIMQAVIVLTVVVAYEVVKRYVTNRQIKEASKVVADD
jgi:simple sugar transport system permease protein